MDIKVPVLPESVQSATLISILVNNGDIVAKDQALFEIETEKAVLEIVAPALGRIEGLNLSIGQAVVAADLLCSLDVSEEITIQEQADNMTEEVEEQQSESSSMGLVFGLIAIVALIFLVLQF